MAQDNAAYTASFTDIPLGLPKGDARENQEDARKGDARSDPEAEDYDPLDHRTVEHPTSALDTMFHLLKGCFGTGILAMPEAFMYAGYAVGLAGTFLVGFICTWAVHILLDAEYELSRRRRVPTLSYQDAGRCAVEDGPAPLRPFAKYMTYVINTFVVANQMGACITYLLFVASNIKAVADHYTDVLDERLYLLFLLVPVILLNWVPNLKYLSFFSSVAMVATFTSFGILFYYLFQTAPSVENRAAVGDISNFPLFLSTAVFSIEAMGVMIPLKNEMKNPKHFGGTFGVLNFAMVPIVILFSCIGFFGYLKYGSDVDSAITLNLPQGDVLAQAVRIMMAFALFVSHGVMNYVNYDTLWFKGLKPICEKRKTPSKRIVFYEYALRTFIVLIHYTLASIFLNLGLVVSLVGALALSNISLTLPAFIHLCTFWHATKSRGHFLVMLLQDGFIILIGLIILVIGTYTSLRDLIAGM